MLVVDPLVKHYRELEEERKKVHEGDTSLFIALSS